MLFSGGLDSATMLALAVAQGFEVVTLYADYGQPNLEIERECAAANSAKYGALDHVEFPIAYPLAKRRGPYYPGRNLLLVSAAAAYAESEGRPTIFIGLVATVDTPYKIDPYPDCSPEFVARANSLLKYSSGMNLHVQAPLIEVQKPGIFSLAEKLGVDPSDTVSCLVARECGECQSCIERFSALQR